MAAAVLAVSRVIRAPRGRVFAAWTEPVALLAWWGPGPVVCTGAEVDLRAGGEYRLANRAPDGTTIWISGRFELVRPPEELIYSWTVGGIAGEPMRVRVRFLDHPEGTELLLTHERIAEPAVRDMHLEGWNGCLDKLEAYVAGRG